MSHILAGDIGGTKTLLQISTVGNPRTPLLQKSYRSADYAGLTEMLDEFLREAGISKIDSACLALPSSISGRRVKLTNLPWVVDADAIAARFSIDQISLINDFEAAGLGIAALQPADLLTLQAGATQAQGVRLVVGAGTGLGVSWLTPFPDRNTTNPHLPLQGEGRDGDGVIPLPPASPPIPTLTLPLKGRELRSPLLKSKRSDTFEQATEYTAHPSEGGHMNFAPCDATQYELLRYLQKRHGHVSYERIVSGPGLVTIFEFLRDSGRAAPSAQLLKAMAEGDAAAAISQSAQHDSEPIARMALDLFVSIYGAFVGNLALVTLPRGGIYIAGGIAAKIAAIMQQGEFLRAFRDKGRFAGLLETLPLYIVTNPNVGLLGANLVARRLTGI